MKKNALQLRAKPLTAFSLPVLLALSACDSNSLSGIESDLANGQDVGINLSTDDDGNLVVSTSPQAPSLSLIHI